jgi:hypothetical protein
MSHPFTRPATGANLSPASGGWVTLTRVKGGKFIVRSEAIEAVYDQHPDKPSPGLFPGSGEPEGDVEHVVVLSDSAYTVRETADEVFALIRKATTHD